MEDLVFILAARARQFKKNITKYLPRSVQEQTFVNTRSILAHDTTNKPDEINFTAAEYNFTFV